MFSKEGAGHGKCYGSTTLGPRGQLVVPVDARKELGLEAGSRLLVFKHPLGEGLLLLKAEAVEDIIGRMSERLAALESEVKMYSKAPSKKVKP